MTSHLMGAAEVAEMLKVSRQRVDQIARRYPDFPKPEVSLSVGRVWARAKIQAWVERHPERGPGTRIGPRVSASRGNNPHGDA